MARAIEIRVAERCQEKEHLRQLLDEAIELVDSLGLAPEIGARLQEVIDMTGKCPVPERPASC